VSHERALVTEAPDVVEHDDEIAPDPEWLM
jgi:hypothetical protein